MIELSRLLALSSSYDLPTVYVSAWVNQIVEEARRLGHSVRQLVDGELTESNLYGVMESYAPEYVVAGGHGNQNVFTGMNLQPLIIACTNDQMLRGAQVLFASCLTGIGLVPSVVSKGGLAAAGFTSEFTWVVSADYDPYTDPYAKPFGRLIVEPMIEVLKGRGWKAWYDTLRRIGAEEKAAWGQVTDDPLAAQVVYFLDHDVRAATFVSATEEMPGFDLSSVLIGGYVLKALLGL